MRNFKELKDNEKEEIAKEMALDAIRREATSAPSDYAKKFIEKYNAIIDEFQKH